MFELTNEQRKCFALSPVPETWTKVKIAASPNDTYDIYAYLDGSRIKKVILLSDEQKGEYFEYSVDEMLSKDGKMLLPKTQKGKPQKLTAANLLKRTSTGMGLSYNAGNAALTNYTSEQSFYSSSYDDVRIESLHSFEKWVRDWCNATGKKELKDISAFASQGRMHQKYHEGDFFRFRINRKLYGYGRILLDYSKLHREGIEYWDMFMGKPLCAAVYHIATENGELTLEQLRGLKMLPSFMIMDNIFYYGECRIIGNAPIAPAEEDYPVHYGRTIDIRGRGIRFQHGKKYVEIQDKDEMYSGFRNGGIGWSLNVKLPVLKACISQNSNAPYWEMMPQGWTDGDLRNPKYREALARILEQVGE